MKIRTQTLLFALLIPAQVGCSDDPIAEPTAQAPAVDPGPSAEELAAEAARAEQQEAFNATVGCYNTVANRSMELLGRYRRDSPEDPGELDCARVRITKPPESGVDECNAAGQRVYEPAPGLTEAVAALAVTYQTYHQVASDAEGYYEREDYSDDDCAHGRELHTRILAISEEMPTRIQAVSEQLAQVSTQRALDALAETEATDGRRSQWHIQFLMLKARSLLDAIPGRDSIENDLENARSGYVSALEELETAHGEMVGYWEQNADEVSPPAGSGRDVNLLGVPVIPDRVGRVVTEATKLRRDLEGDDMSDVQSHAELVHNAFNRLVEAANIAGRSH